MTTSLRGFLKGVRSGSLDHPVLFKLRQRREAEAFADVMAGLERRPRYHVLLPSSNEVRGSVGDQAMVEAFVENVAGPIVVVQLSEDDDVVPANWADEVTAAPIPGLVDGKAVRRRSVLSEYGRLLEGAISFSVIGADVMDGAYSYRRSVQRFTAATYAARAGVDARILGFSWNAEPDPRAIDALREAAAAGVQIISRDPVSTRRLRAAIGERIKPAADLVFSARSVDESTRVELVPEVSEPFVVVNANGLLGAGFDQVPDYLKLIDWLVSRGRQVVLVPHDARKGVEDVAECRRIFEQSAGAGRSVFLVDRLLRPSQIRGLVRHADCVVTGRMHLCIMALWNGVPAVTLAYQGKVEGLMEIFDLPNLYVRPQPGFSAAAIAALEPLLSDHGPYVASIAAGLKKAKELSSRNFDGLPVREA